MVKKGQIRNKSCNIEGSHFFKKVNRQASNRKFKIRKTRERITGGKLFQMEKKENKEKSDNSNVETIAIVNCVVNVPLMLIAIIANALVLFAVLKELLRFVQYRPQFSFAVLLLLTSLLGLHFNQFTLPVNFSTQAVICC